MDALDVGESCLDLTFNGDGVPAGELYNCSSEVNDETRCDLLLHLLCCLDVFVR